MTTPEQDTKTRTNLLKYYVALGLISVVVIPAVFLVMFLQIMPFVSGLPPDLSLLIMVLLLSMPIVVIVYLLVLVIVPLTGEKVDPKLKSFRLWFFGWVFGATLGCLIVFFSFAYDTMFPMLDSDIRSILSPLTVLLIFLVLASPPMRSKTTHFFARLFGTEEYLEQKSIEE